MFKELNSCKNEERDSVISKVCILCDSGYGGCDSCTECDAFDMFPNGN